MKSSYGRAVKKPARYDNSHMLVKCTNQNCVEENNISYFGICTRCSSYFCYQSCSLSQKILKLLKTIEMTTTGFVQIVLNRH